MTLVKQTLPDPADPRVELVRQSARLVAVLPYRGGWSTRRYREHEAMLLKAVADHEGWTAVGTPMWSRYDPPIVPWLMRRNEVAIAVEAAGNGWPHCV
ncbi:MAG: heme-binding protein [Proteobacteria bacterium]|nr:heme-binding protein [Pseudomonadota bacterium]